MNLNDFVEEEVVRRDKAPREVDGGRGWLMGRPITDTSQPRCGPPSARWLEAASMSGIRTRRQRGKRRPAIECVGDPG